MTLFFFYVLLGAVGLAAQVSGSVDRRSGQTVLIETRTVTKEDLILSNAIHRGESFLLQGADYKVKVLSMYDDASTAGQETAFCESFGQWRSLYDNFPQTHFEAAHLISIGDDAILLLRLPTGDVSRRILRGADPTQVDVAGTRLEILFVAGRTRSKFEGCGTPGVIEPVIYLKTTARLTLELCEKATAQLARMFGSSHIWASFRNDDWFLCSQFPVFYPYSSSSKSVPTELGHRNTPEFTCHVSCDGAPKCGLTSGPGTDK